MATCVEDGTVQAVLARAHNRHNTCAWMLVEAPKFLAPGAATARLALEQRDVRPGGPHAEIARLAGLDWWFRGCPQHAVQEM